MPPWEEGFDLNQAKLFLKDEVTGEMREFCGIAEMQTITTVSEEDLDAIGGPAAHFSDWMIDPEPLVFEGIILQNKAWKKFMKIMKRMDNHRRRQIRWMKRQREKVRRRILKGGTLNGLEKRSDCISVPGLRK